MTDQLTQSAIAKVAELARETATAVHELNAPLYQEGIPAGIPVIIDAKFGQMHGTKHLFDEWRAHPERKSGTAKVSTLQSFTDLVNRHKTDNSVIFANIDWRKPSLTAVIDYHAKENGSLADNGKHRVLYEFPLSEEWQAWVSLNGKAMTQQDFAFFIEDRIPELAAPHEEEITYWEATLGGRVAYPNQIVELSRGLKVNAETKLRSNTVLATGEGELTWEEEHRDHKGDRLIVPSLFILQLPPFFRGEKARVPARLRYRVKDGAVTWFYQLYRPDLYITEQVERDFERALDETDLPGFQGAPEMQG